MICEDNLKILPEDKWRSEGQDRAGNMPGISEAGTEVWAVMDWEEIRVGVMGSDGIG